MKSVPLSIALLTALAGAALVYMALQGFGLISGATPASRAANLKGKVQS